MSLEEAIKENTAAIKELIAAYRGGTAPAKAEPEAKKTEVKADEPVLSYAEDVRKPFLALLNSNREAATNLLAKLGVPNLKGFEDQPARFAELAEKIKEAQNG